MLIDYRDLYKTNISRLNTLDRQNKLNTEEAQKLMKQCSQLEQWMFNADIIKKRTRKRKTEEINNDI